MRQTISGLVAVLATIAASVAPAKACGPGCSPCGYATPCAPAYVQPYRAGCVTGCGAAYQRLPDPDAQYHSAPIAPPQYYYVNQGPTYTGSGAFAPYPVYREGGVTNWRAYHRYVHARRPHRGPVLHSYY